MLVSWRSLMSLVHEQKKSHLSIFLSVSNIWWEPFYFNKLWTPRKVDAPVRTRPWCISNWHEPSLCGSADKGVCDGLGLFCHSSRLLFPSFSFVACSALLCDRCRPVKPCQMLFKGRLIREVLLLLCQERSKNGKQVAPSPWSFCTRLLKCPGFWCLLQPI